MPMGKETVFATMGSGQGFGELSFFERGPRPASAYAREPKHLPADTLCAALAGARRATRTCSLVYRNACMFCETHTQDGTRPEPPVPLGGCPKKPQLSSRSWLLLKRKAIITPPVITPFVQLTDGDARITL